MSKYNKKEILRLRKLGRSYGEIHKALGVPKSTLSYLFKNNEWSNKISVVNSEKISLKRRENVEKLNYLRVQKLKKHYEEAALEAKKEYELYKREQAFVAGLMLYVGEGDKTLANNLVRLANTDFKTIKIFIVFLLKFCFVDRKNIKIWLLLYPDLDEVLCKKKWSKETGLSDDHFYKTQVIAGKHKVNRLPYGVGNIILGNKYLKVKILKWIELLSDDILKANADIV